MNLTPNAVIELKKALPAKSRYLFDTDKKQIEKAAKSSGFSCWDRTVKDGQYSYGIHLNGEWQTIVKHDDTTLHTGRNSVVNAILTYRGEVVARIDETKTWYSIDGQRIAEIDL